MTEPNANIPKGKQTELGLYVTAKEAYEKWKADPEKVIDSRRPHPRRVSVCRPSDHGLEDPHRRTKL